MEGWAAFTEDLKVLANKAFPRLQDDAKEQLALSRYLGQLTNHQIAFNVRQKRPQTLDEAVSATLELESYLIPTGLPSVAGILPSQVVAGVRQSQDTMMDMLTKMMERLDRLESDRATPPPRRRNQQCQAAPTPWRENPAPKKPVVCHKCGKEGHFARGCAVSSSQPPGN